MCLNINFLKFLNFLQFEVRLKKADDRTCRHCILESLYSQQEDVRKWQASQLVIQKKTNRLLKQFLPIFTII